MANQLNAVLKMCDDFLEQQRRQVIETEPTPEKAAEFRLAHKWMMRVVRTLHAQVSDPDFPDREFVQILGGRLMQLEELWQVFGEPHTMTEVEASKVLRAVFPE
ncbi:MAG TPA: hypothetical protein VFZ59_22995 [Verrucomicrobiae bacterium]|nr:hypothetical protein [Verrucomicrobiae bacterium]